MLNVLSPDGVSMHIEGRGQSLGGVTVTRKWFPLQGERAQSSYVRSFQKQNREEGETE